MRFPLVSVIILNYNGLKYLKGMLTECLISVLESNYPNMEIIFVDNGSVDGSADYVRNNYPKIKLVRNETNLGFSEGFNTGMRASKGKYLALLSNDMTVDSNWLNSIINLMESEPKIGLAGFKRLIYGEDNLIDGIGGKLFLCGRVKMVPRKHEIDNGQLNQIIEDLDYIGGAMVLRRKTLQKTGLFDPDYFIFAEDADLCYKVRKSGYKIVYVPEAVIWHRGQGTLNAMDSRGLYLAYMYDRSRVRFILIHFGSIRLLSAFLIDLVWFLVTKVPYKIALLKAYWWNIKNSGAVFKRRIIYGASPSMECSHPILPFEFSKIDR